MEHRERVKKFLNLENVDRVPFIDWYGLPHDRVPYWIKEGKFKGEIDICKYMGFDGSDGYCTEPLIDIKTAKMYMYQPTIGMEKVYFDPSAIPKYENNKWVDEKGYLYETEQTTGITLKKIPLSLTNPLGGMEFFRPPVINEKDWLDYKMRFNGKYVNRYPFQANKSEIDHYKNTKICVELRIPGIFVSSINAIGWHGTNNFYDRLEETPRFIEELFDFYEEFIIDLITPALKSFNIDHAALEDLIFYDGGSWVSKSMFTELLAPRYKRIIKYVKDNGIKFVYGHFGGSFRNFIPELLNVGIEGFSLCSRSTNTDVVDLKKEYGQGLRLIGGIDRRVLLNGSKYDIEKEIDRVLSVLHIGGLIPCTDIPMYYGTSFENYEHYARVMERSLK